MNPPPADLTNEYAFADLKSLGETLGFIALPAFSIAVVAVIFYFLIGAFRWMNSGGNKENVQKARDMITHAIIGLLLLILMFLILQYLPEAIGLKGFKIVQ